MRFGHDQLQNSGKPLGIIFGISRKTENVHGKFAQT
jgi:hypothetical protein